jgi:hypothetical protein
VNISMNASSSQFLSKLLSSSSRDSIVVANCDRRKRDVLDWIDCVVEGGDQRVLRETFKRCRGEKDQSASTYEVDHCPHEPEEICQTSSFSFQTSAHLSSKLRSTWAR